MRKSSEDFSIKVDCPSRIDFTGGFTDVAPFRNHIPVYHINAALESRIFVTMRKRSDAKVLLTSEMDRANCSGVEYIDTNIPRRLAAAMLEKWPLEYGLDISIHAKAPVGRGLGASGALSVGLLAGIWGLHFGRASVLDLGTLALEAARIENGIGVLGGYQDQFAAVFGGLNAFRFHGKLWESFPFELDAVARRYLENHLILAHPCGVERTGDIVREVMKSYRSGDPKVSGALYALNQYAGEISSTLRDRDMKRLIELTRLIRTEQQKLHPSIIRHSARALITVIEKGWGAGVKILGGGGTGACVLIVCKNVRSRLEISALLRKRTYSILTVKIAGRGLNLRNIEH